MTLYLGKRAAGSLTKAAPGDTLYIPFATYNDSGAPITDTGFHHSKVEIYKNNEPTARATDSGVWLGDSGLNYEVAGTRATPLEDTGLFGDVAGLYTIGIRLFNTSDDTGFFDAGSSYHVTVQGLKIKSGQGHISANFIPAMFEISGRRMQAGAVVNQGAQAFEQVDLRAVLGDTGAANLDQGRLGVISDSGRQAAVLDTGKVAAAIWTSHATRTLTAFALDTGVRDTVWRASPSSYTSDTGSFGYAAGRVMAVRNDTGAAHLDQGRFGVISDSGRQAAVLDTGKVAAAIWTSHATRTLTAFALDTGVRDQIWRASPSAYTSDTGSFGYAAGRVLAVRNDTGAAHLDQGRFGVISDSGRQAAVLDTGKVASAIWTSHATRTLTAFAFDTGVAQTVWRESGSTYTDTGSLGYMIDNPPAASVDTGVVNRAVWNADASRTLTAFAFDTGVSHTVWSSSQSAFADTGSFAYAQGRVMKVLGDTGAAHLDQGRYGVISDSGRQAAVLDTGKVAAAIWTSHATRTLTSFLFDTGIAQTVWRESGSTYTDTGSLGYMVDNPPGATVDTGVVNRAVWNADASRTLTAFGFDTGVAQTVWRESRSTYTDTGSFGFGVNVHELRNDTGAARHLQELADEYDTGRLPAEASATLDTGAVKDAVWQTAAGVSIRTLTNIDTGAAIHLAQMADEYDTGRLPAEATATLDTGQVNRAVWNADASRTLTAFAFDTGVSHTVWSSSQSGFSDTGSFAYAQGRIQKVLGDTGAAHLDQGRFGVISDSGRQAAVLDTGKVAAAVWTSHATRGLTNATNIDTGTAQHVWRQSTSTFTSDTGSTAYALGRVMAVRNDTGAAHLDQGRFGVLSDTGRAAAVLDTGKVAAAVWTSHATRLLTGSTNIDTGIRDVIWRSSPSSFTSDTGSFGYAAGRLMAVKGDTGAAHLDQGRLGVISDSGRQAAVLDTGKVAAAVWASHATRTLTAFGFDTGIAQTVWRESGSTYTDTGSLGYMVDNPAGVSVDTGVVNRAVWNADASRTLTAFGFDTGVADTVWKASQSTFSDTGSFAYAQGRLMKVNGDTGAAHLDQGRLGVISDSGRQAAVLDTGKVAAAIWTSHATRTLTSFLFDTGVADTVWKYTDTDARMVNVRAILNDTGAAAHLAQAFADQNTNSDTGLIANAAAVRVQTDKLTFDTGANELHADIRKVNNVQVKGGGDTGSDTGYGGTWRPVTEV